MQVGYWEQVVMAPGGVGRIGGESSSEGLGRGGIDRVLTLAPGTERLLLAGERGCLVGLGGNFGCVAERVYVRTHVVRQQRGTVGSSGQGG